MSSTLFNVAFPFYKHEMNNIMALSIITEALEIILESWVEIDEEFNRAIINPTSHIEQFYPSTQPLQSQLSIYNLSLIALEALMPKS
ncbi:hypothetical protein BIZ37_30075 [Photobacterium sp. BZF1]|uniref:hypothetical protein n=1 Tax=Photobacterium sp. BZF1 TaxID=1904457 RepID=UPI0016539F50|nr:hypothetical protein [Photobacterium sp. BZF1]MBC7006796.1 hypothetical protein [Photobacterium sp. BZF1]